MGHYQRVRGHYSPARAAGLQRGSSVPAECFALQVATTALLFFAFSTLRRPPSTPSRSNMTEFRVAKCHAMSQELRGAGAGIMAVVHLLLLLKISSVKFSLSSKAGSSDLVVCREREAEKAERERQKGERKEGWVHLCVCVGGSVVEVETERASK